MQHQSLSHFFHYYGSENTLLFSAVFLFYKENILIPPTLLRKQIVAHVPNSEKRATC